MVVAIAVTGVSARPRLSFHGVEAQQQQITQNENESSVSARPAGFQPPEPWRFRVRQDQWGTILSSSLALPFRLGTGAFAQGYKASWVPESSVPQNTYTSFSVAGHKLVETSKTGPSLERPIEIYEFESCPICHKVDLNKGDESVSTMLSLGFLTALTAGFAMIGQLGKLTS